jgi:glucose 1-dehydrogenase
VGPMAHPRGHCSGHMDRSVLITGVAGGIGAATARLFHNAGWRVFGVDVAENEAATELERLFHVNVSDGVAVAHMFEQLATLTPSLDVLVNNAAIQHVAPLIDTEVDDWDRVMNTNARGVFLMTKFAHELLRPAGGSVVNVASVHSLATSPGMASYVASKGAVMALTRAAALEFASDGIRVNAVLPGAVDTAMLRAGLERSGDDPEQSLASLSASHPLARVGRPEEIAQAILFLADGDRSSFITGQSLVVDGGAMARLSTE